MSRMSRLAKALLFTEGLLDSKVNIASKLPLSGACFPLKRALNRGESYHQLRRAISSVNGYQFRGSSDEEIQLWNECARLVTNAIIYFNSTVLSQLLTSSEHQGDDAKIAINKQA